MGIEAIGSAVGSVASAVGRGAAIFGAKLEAPLSTMVKEGPAPSLVGFRAMGVVDISTPSLGGIFKPLEQLPRLDRVQPELNVADAILEAESILSQARIISLEVPEPAVNLDLPKIEAVRETINWQGAPQIYPEFISAPVLEPATKTESASVTQVGSQPQIESIISHQTTQTSPTPSEQEQEVEEVVKEKAKVEDLKTSLEEEVLEDERLYLEDEQASAQRKYEIKEAVNKAKVAADRLGLRKITGWLVAKFLPAEHEGNRSQVVKKKGPDGSYQETVEAISLTGEFASEQQAQQKFIQIIEEKSPIRKGKHGRPVSNEAVARVFKYHFVKPVAHEVVQKRIVKKVVQATGQNQAPVVVTETPEIKNEPTIEDYPALTEVFQKAAA